MREAPRSPRAIPGPLNEVRITVRLNEQLADLTLDYPLNPDHGALLRQMHEGGPAKGLIECRMHDDDPNLREYRGPDGRVHGAWLYLRRHGKGLLLCHWPNGIIKGESHAVPSPMTPEHRRRQEYIALRGEAAGYQVDLEKSIAFGTRSDVVIRGEATMTAEVQQSGISLPTVIRRDNRAVAAGAVPTWLSDVRNPHYGFRVAHIETNEREGMDRGTWTVVTGPRSLEHEKCTPSSRLGACPSRKRGWCGQWHPLWVPTPGMCVDDVVERVPAGALVRIDTASKQGVILGTPDDRDTWVSATGLPVEVVVPAQRTRSSRNAHPAYSWQKLAKRLDDLDPELVTTERGRILSGRQPRVCVNCLDRVPGFNSTLCGRCFGNPERFRAPGVQG